MNTTRTPKRGSAFTNTAKVFIITASLAATVGGWAAISAPAASTTANANSSGGGAANALAQLFSASPSSVQFQPAIRTRSSR